MQKATELSLAAMVLSTLAWTCTPARAASDTAEHGDAMPLSRALSELADKHHLQVVYVSDLIASQHTVTVPQGVPVEQALTSVLKNTGLEFEFINARTVRIYAPSPLRTAADRQPVSALAAPVAATQETASDTNLNTLAEIIVTAQRRGENLQQVPVAVTAASSAMLEQMGATGSLDIPVVAPAVTFSSSVGGSRITIRGIGSSGSLGDESANAVYVDGVYLSSLPSLLLSFNNIERLEILKGPQGTLFGRNASGGVIQIVTRKPSADPQAKLMLGYGSYDMKELSFYGTHGVVDNLAADLAVYVQNQGNGWGNYLPSGAEAYNGKASTARTSWLWTPSEATSLRLSVLYGNTKAPTNRGGQVVVGETTPVPGNASNLGFYNSSADVQQDFQVKQWNYSLNLNQDLGWGKLINITSRDDVSAQQVIDNNYSPLGNKTTFDRYSKTWTEELQLQSRDDARVSWILGGFYFSNNQGLSPALTRTSAGALARNLNAYMDTRSTAVFGQATFPVFEATKLTLGARYTHDDHEIDGTIATAASTTVQPAKSRADSKATYRLALDHRFTDDVMGYVSYSTGFKSGFYSLTSPTDEAVRPQTVDAYEVGVKSEWLEHRLRLNAAGFFYKFDDIQVRTVAANSQVSFFNAAAGEVKGVDLELEASPIKDLTLRAAATFLNTRYTDFNNALQYHVDPVTHLLLRDPSASAEGNKLINAPDLVFTVGVDYRVPFSWGSLNFDASYNYNDGFYFDAQNRLAQPSVQLVNASVSYLTPAEHWRVRLYGNNLADKQYYSNLDITDQVGDIYWPAAPRTFGGQVTWSFK